MNIQTGTNDGSGSFTPSLDGPCFVTVGALFETSDAMGLTIFGGNAAAPQVLGLSLNSAPFKIAGSLSGVYLEPGDSITFQIFNFGAQDATWTLSLAVQLAPDIATTP